MRACTVCGVSIYAGSKSGLCRPHFVAWLNVDPAVHAKRREGNIRFSATPEGRLNTRLRNNALSLKRRSDPAWGARAAEHMRRNIQPLSYTPENLAKRDDAARGRTVSATKMAWCPSEYRDLYRSIKIRDPRMKTAEARQIILDHAKAERARMSPFERQDAAIKKMWEGIK